MRKNLYYRTVSRRRNAIKETIYDFFLSSCSIPRLLLEVFIRANFGERYFSFSTAMIATFILALVPIGSAIGLQVLASFGGSEGDFQMADFVLRSLTWYIFLAGFVVMCFRRRNEIEYLPSVFDFGRYSLSSGDIHPSFRDYRPYDKQLSIRTIETLVEPGFFLVIGLVLWLLQQTVGSLIIVSSICYSLSYFGAYHRGDNFIMDQIDEMIYNEELTANFIEGRIPNETRGVDYRGRKPADPDMRRRLAEHFIQEDDIVMAM